jgi:CheY-like chemotaxis protein
MNKQTILVVEDEDLLLQAITKKLALNEIDTIGCTSGKQALDYLNNLAELPAAVWLDYHLQDMNGLEFMQVLRQDPRYATIPVIVVSNSANDETVKSILALGAKKYLLKAEHRLDDIVATVKQFIEENSVQ